MLPTGSSAWIPYTAEARHFLIDIKSRMTVHLTKPPL
jgi:hypothetical protein